MSDFHATSPGNGVPRIALSRIETATAIGVSPRTVDQLIADRTSGFPFTKIGTRVVVSVRDLEKWLRERANKH